MNLGSTELLSPSDSRWPELLRGLPHDIYHSADYHRSPQLGREGEPFLFAYREGEQTFLWPYLVVPIEAPASWRGSPCYDVTSVYGYAGPVTSADPEFIARGWRALMDQWRMQGAVSAFTRFHPLLGNDAVSGKLQTGKDGTCEDPTRLCGATISIDLGLDSSEQIRRYQKVLRQEVRQSRELGFTTFLDDEWSHADDFVRLYRDTMSRRAGKSEYLIDNAWLSRFRESLGPHAHLFVTKYEGQVASALLAMEYGPFLHAHLTGINADLVAHSPLKVMLDDIRQWGTDRGLKSFHLGGGLGGQQDSLYRFKRRFSPDSHEFRIGCWILKPGEYAELTQARRRELAGQGIEMGEPGFFPAYRFQVSELDLEMHAALEAVRP